ncbi:hypothetical protein BZG36_04517 [Bifiguratus adelaidae]|uniref:Uncharacterized protein n=1 Tax=Bifiguratus adelaidae TaxID=1938954 RepID=A0A261XX92_9FUNG|nr:hypothetical protein BZG36_04517 [Bifiguratus adelaidae]
MGNDGGSIPKRNELVKEKQKEKKADQSIQQIAAWFYCALSKRPLQVPVVSCALGKLYNRDAILEFLLDRSSYGDGDVICSHITSIKDVKTLNLTPNPTYDPKAVNDASIATIEHSMTSQFVCPLSQREMNGRHRFVYLQKCGCVYAESALKEVPNTDCSVCGKPYEPSDLMTINPTKPEEIAKMKAAMIEKKAAELEKRMLKKSKKNSKTVSAYGDKIADAVDSNKRKASPVDDIRAPVAKKPTPIPVHAYSDDIRSSSPSSMVIDKVAKEIAEKKRGTGASKEMSSAIKSIYNTNKDQKGTWMTMGTFTRYA